MALIIATHYANIPVSGDAELILVMQADDRQGCIGVDGIASILRDGKLMALYRQRGTVSSKLSNG